MGRFWYASVRTVWVAELLTPHCLSQALDQLSETEECRVWAGQCLIPIPKDWKVLKILFYVVITKFELQKYLILTYFREFLIIDICVIVSAFFRCPLHPTHGNDTQRCAACEQFAGAVLVEFSVPHSHCDPNSLATGGYFLAKVRCCSSAGKKHFSSLSGRPCYTSCQI